MAILEWTAPNTTQYNTTLLLHYYATTLLRYYATTVRVADLRLREFTTKPFRPSRVCLASFSGGLYLVVALRPDVGLVLP